MKNADQVKKIMANEKNLDVHIDNIYKLSEKQIEIKAFYKEQVRFLKAEFKNNNLSQEELNTKLEETKKVYEEYKVKVQENLDLNYSISIWEYDQSEALKESIDYAELKKEYQAKLEKVKTDKEKKLAVKKEYAHLKKNIKPKWISYIAIGSILVILLACLLVNYLYYFQWANAIKLPNEERIPVPFTFSNPNHLVGFIFMLIGVGLILGFLAFMVLNVTKRTFLDKEENLFVSAGIGGVAYFMDTIGVGSFAITVAGLKTANSVKNVKYLPGTLNVGLTIPNLIAGTLFVSAISIDLTTLITLVVAAMIGSFLGAKIVSKVNKKFVSLTIAICLFIAAILMILTHKHVNILDLGATNGLTDWRLAVGIISFFIIGGLQSFGVGLYAPAFAVTSLLGLNTSAVFPIMTCASGFAMPASSWVFHRDNNYSPKVSCGLMLGGVVGTMVAFMIVFVGIQGGGGIDMTEFTNVLKWIAVVVVFYGSFMLGKTYYELRKEVPVIKEPVHNLYQEYGAEYLSMFKKNMEDISGVKAFKQEDFQKTVSDNNINLLKWK